MFLVGSSQADDVTEEDCGKWGTIHPYGARYLEIIFTLLIKMIAVYMGYFGIGIRGPSFEWAILWLCQDLGLSRLHEHLYESGKKVFNRGKNKR